MPDLNEKRAFSHTMKYCVLVIGSFLGIIILTLIVGLCVFIFFNLKHDKKDHQKESYDYRFIEINFERNKASNGLVTTQNPLKENFLSYDDGDGNFYIISDFESDEYVCTGSCVCGERRSTTVSTSLKYLVAALSSVLAFSLAEKHFQEECQNLMCESSDPTIMEVEGCKIIGDIIMDEHGWLPSDDDPKYWCEGNCLFFEDNINLLELDDELDEEQFIQEKRDFCQNLKLECEVFSVPGPIELDPDIELRETEEYFRLSHLRHFCNDNSMLMKKDMQEFLMPQYQGKKVFKKYRIYWCENGNVNPDGSIKIPKIKCRKMN